MSKELHPTDLALKLFIDKSEVMGRKPVAEKKKLKHIHEGKDKQYERGIHEY